MPVTETTTTVAGNVISESHLVANNMQEQIFEKGNNIGYVPQNFGGNVMYIQHQPHSDTRVTNAMQGREFNIRVNDITGTVMQNKAPERVMYVEQKALEDTGNSPSEDESPPKYTNIESEGVVCVQPNIAEGNVGYIISGKATSEPNSTNENAIKVPHNTITNDPNQTPVQVIYIPYASGSDIHQSGLPGVILHNPNSTQGQVQYATHNLASCNPNNPQSHFQYAAHNMPNRIPSPNNSQCYFHHMPQNMPNQSPSPNNSQGHFQYAPHNMLNPIPLPNNSQGHFQYVPHNMPNRTPSPHNSQGYYQTAPNHTPNGMPSPNQIEGRSLEVLNQAMNMAGKLLLPQKDNKDPENVCTIQPMASPIVYSPYIMGDESGFIPQMQYQTQHVSQALLTPAYNMQPVNQLSYVPPISQPVQDSLYMSSPPINTEQVSFVSDYIPSQQPDFDMSNVGTQIVDNIGAGNGDCFSWYDCCCCFFSCCGSE